jgi:putative SOS response-associated peptidase YedK
MCGRTTHDLSWPELHALFGVIGSAEDGSASPPPNDFRASWNIAPTTRNPVCRLNQAGAREIAILRWGLVPSWAQDLKIGAQCINAVGETVAGKPAFRSAFKSRRCLVPARLFYEWQKTADPKVKQPYAIGLRSGQPMVFAGLWEWWKDPAGGEEYQTYAIVTTTPNELMAKLHNRMPVILAREDWPAWLGEVETTPEQRQALLRPYAADQMTAWPVTTDVNNSRNNRPDLVAPIGEPLAA